MTAWTDERRAELRERWERGECATQIAAALGGSPGRNAIIAEAHRLNLEYQPTAATFASETNKDRSGRHGSEVA